MHGRKTNNRKTTQENAKYELRNKRRQIRGYRFRGGYMTLIVSDVFEYFISEY